MKKPATENEIIQSELHCHECNGYFKIDLNLGVNGNHVFNCPNCRHEHCRVVKDGIVTGDRWGQRNGTNIRGYAYGWTATYTQTASQPTTSWAQSAWYSVGLSTSSTGWS